LRRWNPGGQNASSTNLSQRNRPGPHPPFGRGGFFFLFQMPAGPQYFQDVPGACTVPRCGRPQRGGNGLCGAHNNRRSRGKPLDTPLRHYKVKGCSVAGCTRPHTAKGRCFQHWREDRYGTPQRRQRTPAERAAIQKLYAAGVNMTEISRRFDCSRNTVMRIVRGKTFQPKQR
jgi:hypothetical protein